MFQENPEKKKLAYSKCVAFEGDLSAQRLGMSDHDYDLIKSELNIIISNAASVNWTDPIKDAISTNYHGAM